MSGVPYNRGFVLIVVLAALAILALLGIAFVTLQSVERDISRTYLDTVRAQFAASSGVEYALERLRRVLNSSGGPFPMSSLAQSLIYYGDQTNEFLGPNPTTSLKTAKNPSFAVEGDNTDITDAPSSLSSYNPAPRIIKVDGDDVGYSGAFEAGTYGKDSDTYTLKITDANGKIYVNDGLGHAANTERLRNILNNLGAISTVGVPGLGDRIITNRPATGYSSNRDLRKLFSDPVVFERVRNFVTVYAWVDSKVPNPVPLSPDVLADYPVQYVRPAAAPGSAKPPSYPAGWGNRIYRYGRQVNYRNQANASPITWGSNIYGWDEVNPQYIEVTSRAPVNVNVAPREVLIALLQGIQGFFVMETPADPTIHPYGFYCSAHRWEDTTTGPPQWFSHGYYPSQIGIIYKTLKVGSGGPAPTAIADKIIANRSKRLGTGDITQPYHGPFTSWAQFNLFMDSLVVDGTIVDTRFTGLRQKFAAQAMADAVKANFNPNLHLNEVNPDENLHTLVDKTDLIYNTTEFCFAYRGIFEIESLGRILKPVGSSTEYRTVAERTIQCAVKLYDVTREGTQNDFYRGEVTIDGPAGSLTEAAPHTAYRTNSNRSLETGPEPDNGLAPSENEYEGYLRLSTIGGDLPIPATSSSAVAGMTLKPSGTVWETPRGNQTFGASMRAHFTYDFDLAYAIAAADPANDVRRRALTRNWNRGASVPGIAQTYYNYADWSEKNSDGTEKVAGPYSLSDSPGITLWAAGIPGLREYRIARSYRLAAGTGLAPSGKFFAPSDLRADGAYSERHAAPVYWPGSATTWESYSNSNIYTVQGTCAFWIKPGFYPELAGKFRNLFSQSKMWYVSSGDRYAPWDKGGSNINIFNPNNMGMHFLPINASGLDNGFIGFENRGGVNDPSHYVRAQRIFSFGFNYSPWSGTPGEGFWHQGTYTDTVNHVGHVDDGVIRNKFKAHRWTFLTLRWSSSIAQGMLVNGSSWGVKFTDRHAYGTLSLGKATAWNRNGVGAVWNSVNPVRLGEPSILVPPSIAGTPGSQNANLTSRSRNFSADGTIDEFYVWNNLSPTTPGGGLGEALSLWRLGRYYRHNDGRFTSGSINLNSMIQKNLPPAIALSPDPEVIPETLPSVTLTSTPKLIGISWSQYAEDCAFGNASDPVRYRLFDYQPWSANPAASPTVLPSPRLEFQVSGGGGWSAVVTDSRWSKLEVAVSDPTKIKYTVKFVTNSDRLNSILLSSPVLDDVLLYFDMGNTGFLEYIVL